MTILRRNSAAPMAEDRNVNLGDEKGRGGGDRRGIFFVGERTA